MDLQQQFEAAARQVDHLDAATAAPHMTDLYGLYKQATEGDVNMQPGEVSATEADKPSGPAGLSQAQWESWDKYKGTTEDDAKRQYVARVAAITSGSPGGNGGTEAGVVATDTRTGAPDAARPQSAAHENDTTAQQPGFGPGQPNGGLRGDITAGAPYGGEDKLKGAQ